MSSSSRESTSTRITSFTISDLSSFRAATSDSHEIGGLYALSQLDVLADLARMVAADFFARPELYKEFVDKDDDPSLVTGVAQLHARYGSDERLPDRDQRMAMFAPMFADADGDFIRYRDALLSAAATFAEWGQPTGIPMLYEAVRTAHRPFQEHLRRFVGVSLSYSRNVSLPYLTERVCYRMLREQGITSVFSVHRPPSAAWPYVPDAMGDQLVEEIGRRLGSDEEIGLTRHAFSLRQRAALRGAEAIAAILDYAPQAEDQADLDVLITKCYTWHAALQGVTGLGFGPPRPAFTGGTANGDGDVRRMAVQLFQR